MSVPETHEESAEFFDQAWEHAEAFERAVKDHDAETAAAAREQLFDHLAPLVEDGDEYREYEKLQTTAEAAMDELASDDPDVDDLDVDLPHTRIDGFSGMVDALEGEFNKRHNIGIWA